MTAVIEGRNAKFSVIVLLCVVFQKVDVSPPTP